MAGGRIAAEDADLLLLEDGDYLVTEDYADGAPDDGPILRMSRRSASVLLPVARLSVSRLASVVRVSDATLQARPTSRR